MGKKYNKDQGASNGHSRKNFNRHKNEDKEHVQNREKIRILNVSLEDFFKGCTKNISFSRKITQPDGKIIQENKVLTVNVTPGMRTETKVIFQGEGDQVHGESPADIAVIIKLKPHNLFIREDSNIKYILKLSLKKALNGTTVKIPTLTGEKIILQLTAEMINPKMVKQYPGHGLPFPEEPSRKGDLLVTLEIEFPEIWKKASCTDYIARSILCVSESASVDEIKKAYKTLALWYHPDKNPSPDSEEKFKKILEAYETLTKKKTNDKFSEDNPRTESPTREAPNSRSPKQEPPKSGFYQSTSEDEDLLQDPPKEYDLYVTLEEVFTGCTKKMKISRNVLQPDGSTKTKDEILSVDVKRGSKAETKIIFKKEDDQCRERIVFVIKDKPHPLLKRDGSNVIFNKKLSFRAAVRNKFIDIPTLSNDTLFFYVNPENVKPGNVRKYEGYGLPLPKKPWRRGDFLVSVDIQYPEIRIHDYKCAYEILGIEYGVSISELKIAYQLLDQWFRLEENRKPGWEEKIKKISEVYAILSEDILENGDLQ